MTVFHATCIAFAEGAVLLRGPSGAGKSDLGLRLIDGGGLLVADDYVDLHLDGGALIARAPEKIKGLMEVRGLGLVPMATLDQAPLRLLVDLVPEDRMERMPEPSYETLMGLQLPLFALYAFEPSAAAKVRLAFARCLASTDLSHARHSL
ncbi:HPr kinase/phosphorylase [alpha proteobacterium Q-1]|nr:HPr kinase/phosphorylase [alpha proteobacterium Q-1]